MARKDHITDLGNLRASYAWQDDGQLHPSDSSHDETLTDDTEVTLHADGTVTSSKTQGVLVDGNGASDPEWQEWLNGPGVEIEVKLEEEWEYLDTVMDEQDAVRRIRYENAPYALFRICSEDGGGPDEYQYWQNGQWVDAGQA